MEKTHPLTNLENHINKMKELEAVVSKEFPTILEHVNALVTWYEKTGIVERIEKSIKETDLSLLESHNNKMSSSYKNVLNISDATVLKMRETLRKVNNYNQDIFNNNNPEIKNPYMYDSYIKSINTLQRIDDEIKVSETEATLWRKAVPFMQYLLPLFLGLIFSDTTIKDIHIFEFIVFLYEYVLQHIFAIR